MEYKNVEKFVKNELLIYEGEKEDELDAAIMGDYAAAVADVERWLRSVLAREMVEGGYDEVGVSLTLPLETLTVTMRSESDAFLAENVPATYFPKACTAGKGKPEMFLTPIGDMDFYTYKAVTEEEGNPVKLLYRHMGFMMLNAHVMLSMPLHDSLPLGLRSGELMREHNLQDVLNLHNMDLLLHGIVDFLDGRKEA